MKGSLLLRSLLEGKVRLEANPPVPATRFVDASGKSFNKIPPNDFSFFEMISGIGRLDWAEGDWNERP